MRITPFVAYGDWNTCLRSATRRVMGQFPGVPLAVAHSTPGYRIPLLRNYGNATQRHSTRHTSTFDSRRHSARDGTAFDSRCNDIRVEERRHSIATGKVAMATATRGATWPPDRESRSDGICFESTVMFRLKYISRIKFNSVIA